MNVFARAGLAAGLVALATGTTVAGAAEVRVIASNPQGSVFYSASVTVGKILNEKLNMQVRVQPMGGSSTYIPLLNRGEVDFGLTNVDDSVKAYKGAGHFKRANPNMRLMVALFPLTLGIIVPADSPIQKVADLKGKRMPSGYRSQVTGVVLQNAVLWNGGLTMKDIRPVPAPSLFAGVDLLAEGKVDAATISIGTAQGQRAHAELSSRGGIRFLNLDGSPNGVAAIRKYLPARSATVQPAKNRIGIVGPTTIMTYTIFLTTNDKMPEDVVYNLVRTLSVSKAEMVKGTPALAGFDPSRMAEEIGVPWHPGAIRFYKEKAQWPPRD
jgi:hypothetical protein